MKQTLYSKQIMRYFKKPKNIGIIKNADGKGRVGNLICGDVMELYIKIKNNKIVDAKFQTFGCVVALAVSSILTEMIKGKSIEQAIRITNKDILKKTGKVPPIKVHCSFLAADALKESIYDYLSRNNRTIPEELQKDHEKIKSNLEKVESTYGEHVELEEKLLNK
jgi:nitrogen fixation NifU-like protein